jgi:hypothetical protein
MHAAVVEPFGTPLVFREVADWPLRPTLRSRVVLDFASG